MELTLAELAGRLNARLVGDGSILIRGAAGIREASAGEITFLANPRYREFVGTTAASAVILPDDFADPPSPSLLARDPYLAFLEALSLFHGGRNEDPPVGIHPSAVLEAGVRLGPGAAVGPHVSIGANSVIGAGSVLMAGVYVGPDVRIGDDCRIFPGVVILRETEIGHKVVLHSGVVIGDDGFGFAPDGAGYRKIPQVGKVVIEDDVEIGSNTTIDRATTGVTRIARGCRIDNLVMIAHNVEVGGNTVICGQAGISGSTRIGRHVTLAGQAGINGHIEIGDGVRVGAQGGVTKSIPAGETWSGYPAQPHVRASRVYAASRHLPEAIREIRLLESRVRELEKRLEKRDRE